MHEDYGAHADREPDPAERAYRIEVALDRVPEVAGIALMQRIGDLLIEEGLASPEGGDVRAIVTMYEHAWAPSLVGVPHVLIPRAIPQSPDLGSGYSPN